MGVAIDRGIFHVPDCEPIGSRVLRGERDDRRSVPGREPIGRALVGILAIGDRKR